MACRDMSYFPARMNRALRFVDDGVIIFTIKNSFAGFCHDASA
jgi:hypothetical protein